MDQENRLSIGKINGVEIYAVKKEDGTVLVPIKPICKAIGIDSEDELQRIQGDRRLLRASVTITTEGNGGRELEMLCLPLKETLGWIFSIQSFMVDESIRDQVEKYRDECYDAIYGRLQGDSVRLIKSMQGEIDALEKIRECLEEEGRLKDIRGEAVVELARLYGIDVPDFC